MEPDLGDAFWRENPRYDGAAFGLGHLQPVDRTLVTPKGTCVPLRFRFSYHCCTDKLGRRDLGTRIHEATRPDEERYFCPVRWFLSPRLSDLVRRCESMRLAPVPGYQWLYQERISGISLPWVVWMKVMPGPPNGPVIVAVESAYLAADPPKGGEVQTLRFIAEQTRRAGTMFGLPPRGRI